LYSQNPKIATSLPNTKVILCGPSLPMRPKARVLALISVMPKILCAVQYSSSWNCQMLAAEQLLPGQAAWVALQASIMVKIAPTGPYLFIPLLVCCIPILWHPALQSIVMYPITPLFSLQAVGTCLKLNREHSLHFVCHVGKTQRKMWLKGTVPRYLCLHVFFKKSVYLSPWL
jgi:hypothetical protein